MKKLYVSEKKRVSELPSLTSMHKRQKVSLVNQQNVYKSYLILLSYRIISPNT